jgi:hypothetical protein
MAMGLGFRLKLIASISRKGSQSLGKSTWATWPVACTPESVLPAPKILGLEGSKLESEVSISP